MGARRQKQSNAAPAATDATGITDQSGTAEQLQKTLSEGDGGNPPAPEGEGKGSNPAASDGAPGAGGGSNPPAPEGEKPPAETPKSKGGKRYFVEKGKSITSKKGVLDQHAEVTAGILSGGQATLDSLKRRGIVYKAVFPRTDDGAKQADLAAKVAAERGG